ncbi:hypothetical protein Are01nite_53920 [Actinoplanes regularis]|nr:hypothetical protein Are01nite_53920 [Actinoplanes regularis]
MNAEKGRRNVTNEMVGGEQQHAAEHHPSGEPVTLIDHGATLAAACFGGSRLNAEAAAIESQRPIQMY